MRFLLPILFLAACTGAELDGEAPGVAQVTEVAGERYEDPGQEAALAWLAEQEKDTTRGWYRAISRSDYIQSIRERIENPVLVHQRSLNLCGPATLTHLWIRHQPMRFAQRTLELYDKGAFSDGNWTVKANPIIQNEMPKDDRGRTMDPVDWCLLCSIRHCENKSVAVGYDPRQDDEGSAYTPPEELISWFQRLGARGGRIIKAKDLSLDSLNQLVSSGRDVIALVDSDHLFYGKDGGMLYRMFGNHYVVMRTPVTIEEGMASGETWTWGRVENYRLEEAEFRKAVKKYIVLDWGMDSES